MILRRYGRTLHSVEPNFNPRALTEVGFRRDGAYSLSVDEFERQFRVAVRHGLAPDAEGDVQDETEAALLDRLLAELQEIDSRLGPSEVLLVENGSGVDHPKTRQQVRNVIVDGENRLRFRYSLAPELRVVVFRKDGGQ